MFQEAPPSAFQSAKSRLNIYLIPACVVLIHTSCFIQLSGFFFFFSPTSFLKERLHHQGSTAGFISSNVEMFLFCINVAFINYPPHTVAKAICVLNVSCSLIVWHLLYQPYINCHNGKEILCLECHVH